MLHTCCNHVHVVYYVNVLNSLLDLQKQVSDVVQIPRIVCIQWAELHNHMKICNSHMLKSTRVKQSTVSSCI